MGAATQRREKPEVTVSLLISSFLVLKFHTPIPNNTEKNLSVKEHTPSEFVVLSKVLCVRQMKMKQTFEWC
jgi:hypothetical protein